MPDEALGIWVRKQRYDLRTDGTLPKNRVAKLDQLNFMWLTQNGQHESIWMEMFERLKGYKLEHGDCLVPSKYCTDRKLGKWVFLQRTIYKSGKMRLNRAGMLYSVGFVWSLRAIGTITDISHNNDRLGCTSEKQAHRTIHNQTAKGILHWDDMYERLRAFHQTHGNCNAPIQSTELHGWMSRQRRDQSSLCQEQVTKLSSLGFDWETRPQNLERQWNEMFDKLQAYKAQNGNCNVPQSGYTQDLALADWVSSQRKTRDTLTRMKKKKLDEIGFVWCDWDAMYSTLVDFHAQHGNADVPRRYKADEALAQWVKKQRKNGLTGNLTENRAAQLDQLKFEWK
jgi:Tfp pilus assembly protein PilV